MKRKNVHAVALGKLGGRVKSEAKTKAAQENGKLGGRPRKPGSRPRAPKLELTDMIERAFKRALE
jgi:hypothetical protein